MHEHRASPGRGTVGACAWHWRFRNRDTVIARPRVVRRTVPAKQLDGHAHGVAYAVRGQYIDRWSPFGSMVITSKQCGSLDGQQRQKESMQGKLLAFHETSSRLWACQGCTFDMPSKFRWPGEDKDKQGSKPGIKHGKGRGWPDWVLAEGLVAFSARQRGVEAVAR
jgi:hypothetical protein